MSFTSLGLSNLLSETIKTIHTSPTPLQQQAIPVALQGSDLIVTAPAGAGKLASFILPILEKATHPESTDPSDTTKRIRVLILVTNPIQAIRVTDYCNVYGANLPITTGCLVTGVSKTPQVKIIENGIDILVACPERLMDILSDTPIDFSSLSTLVLDEADKLIDNPLLTQVLSLLPNTRQTLLFSHMHTPKIYEFANSTLINPTQINLVTELNEAAPLLSPSIEQAVYYIPNRQKPALLAHLVQYRKWPQVFVFIRTKHCASQLASYLEKKGISVSTIYNSINIQADDINEHLFNDSAQVILAIDTVIPKLDSKKFPCIVNFDLPFIESDYIQRTRCTTDTGCAISFVSPEEEKLLLVIENFINQKISDGDLLGFVFDETELSEQDPERFRRIFRHPAVGRKSRKKATKKEPFVPNAGDNTTLSPLNEVALRLDLSEEDIQPETTQTIARHTQQAKAATPRKKVGTGLYSKRKKTAITQAPLDLPPDRPDDEFRDDEYDNFGNSVNYISPYAGKEKKANPATRGLAGKRRTKTAVTAPKVTPAAKPKVARAKPKTTVTQEQTKTRNSLYRRKSTRTNSYKPLDTSPALPEPSEYPQKRNTTAPAIILRKHSRLDKLPTIEQLDSLSNRHISHTEKPALLTRKNHDE